MKILKLKNSYWRDVLLQASGNTTAQIIGILFMPILTRLYTPDSFAVQAVFIQSVVLLNAFVSFRFEFLLQLLKSDKEANSLLLWIVKHAFFMSIMATILVFVMDKLHIFLYFNISSAKYFYFVPITAYLMVISVAFNNNAQRKGDFKITSLSAVTRKVGYVSSGIILSFFTHTLGLILTTIFGAIGSMLSLRKDIFIFLKSVKKINPDSHLIRAYRGRAAGLVISNSILTSTTFIPILFISRHYGEYTLGQFSLVLSTVFLPAGLIGSAVGNVFYQRAASLWNAKEYLSLKDLWYKTILRLVIIGLPAYTTLYFISPYLYPLIFGKQWELAGEFASLMSITAFFSFLAGPIDRLSLVFGIAYYLPMIHVLRFLIVSIVAFIAYSLSLKPLNFILLYSASMSFVYLIDIIVTRFYFMEERVKNV